MSRTRNFSGTSANSVTGIGTSPAYSITVRLGGGFGDFDDNYLLCQKSSITDELTPKGSERTYNPVTHVRRSAATCSGETTFTWYTYRSDCLLRGSGFKVMYLDSPTLPSADWASLINSLADQLDGRIDNGSLLLVTLAEAKKTYQMIRNPFTLLKTDWRRRASSHSAAALSKRGANIWLEHRYGWLSLYNDLKSMSKTLAGCFGEQADQALGSWWGRYSATQQVTVPAALVYPWPSSLPIWNSRYNNCTGYAPACRFYLDASTVSYTLGCRARMDATERYSKSRRFLSAFGLDAPSILSTVWELVPFSFVVDWFVDTKGIWTAPNLARLSGHTIKHLGFSKSFECSYGAEICWGENPLSYIYDPYNRWSSQSSYNKSGQIWSGSTKGSYSLYERNIGTPAVSTFYSPFLAKGLSLTQAISGVSLILQKILK